MGPIWINYETNMGSDGAHISAHYGPKDRQETTSNYNTHNTSTWIQPNNNIHNNTTKPKINHNNRCINSCVYALYSLLHLWFSLQPPNPIIRGGPKYGPIMVPSMGPTWADVWPHICWTLDVWENDGAGFGAHLVLHLLCALDAHGDVETMQRLSVYNLLAPPGTLLQHSTTQAVVGLVLKSEPTGLLVMACSYVKKQGVVVLELRATRIDDVKYVRISSPLDYKAATADIADPSDARYAARGTCCLQVLLQAKPSPLLEWSVLQGLQMLNLAGLKTLYDILGIAYARGHKPKSDDDLTKALLLAICGEEGLARFDEVKALRGKADDEVDLPTNIDEESKMHLDTEPDDEWFEQFQEAEKLRKAKIAKKMACRPTPAEVEPAPAPVLAKKLVKFPSSGIQQAVARKYCAGSSTLTKSTIRTKYWQVRCKLDENTSSKAYTTTGFTDRSALIFCLRKSWQWHVKHFPSDKCPYIFDEDLVFDVGAASSGL
jgi:hypothetical protein